jgi:phospholipase C
MRMTGSIDPNGEVDAPVLDTGIFIGAWPTYAEALTDAGVTWRGYSDNGLNNVIQLFEKLPQRPTDSVLYESGVANRPREVRVRPPGRRSARRRLPRRRGRRTSS